MTDGLKAHHRAAIIATLAANHRVEQAVLFGSRAMGAHTVTSDVDIALFGRQLTLTDQAKLAAACEELSMAQSVDLVLHSTIDNPALVEHIRSHGVEWYRRGGSGSVVDLTESDGNVPAWRKIEDIARIRQGRYMSPDQLSEIKSKDMSVPVWGANGIIGYTKEATYENAQALVTCRGNGCGLVQWSQGRANVSNNAMAIVLPKEDKDSSRYLYYTLLASDFSDVITGSAQPQITMGHLNKKEVYWHRSRNQRKAIAHILGTLDDKIELNRKTNETLEAMARALFKSWFVDFDPVRAKAEGRSTGLPDQISALFPDSFEDSELGEIPRGWGVGTISELIDIDPARRLAKGSIASYLEMKGVSTSGHTVTGVYPRKFTSGTKFQLGDTLLARITPCLENGKTALVDFLEEGEIGWGSTEFIVMCGKKFLHNSFVYCLARSEEFRSYAIRNMVGSSGRQRVPSSALADFQMSLPPNYLVDYFSVLCRSFLEKISKASAESATLSSIRDTLLPKLISGEIRIGEAEKIIEVAI